MTDYAMDFAGSLLWTEAENRLHTQRGLMAYLMGPLAHDFDAAPFTEEEAAARPRSARCGRHSARSIAQVETAPARQAPPGPGQK